MEIDNLPSASDEVRDVNDCSICLALNQNDHLFSKKKKLLERQGFKSENCIYLKCSLCSEEVDTVLKELVQIARIIHLNEPEMYFGEDDACTPADSYSPRNEMEALNTIISLVDICLSSCKPVQLNVLQELRKAAIRMIHKYGDVYSMEAKTLGDSCVKENSLLQWGESNGVRTSLKIAYVEGAGRGAIAKEDLNVGDTVLEIPLDIVISEELVQKTTMYPILSKIEGMSSETMLLIWSMKEKHIADSKFKVYFDTLPEAFNTGLSFGVGAMMTLDGTLLFGEIMQAKEHLREQYNELFPTLCNNHPDVFPEEYYSWEKFLWACELWYSNSMKIMFSDGSLTSCLVPIAGFLNHSLHPHILHYSKADSDTNSLKFRLSRPCRAGEECYLSYGNYSASHLVAFYGFLPEGDNVNDVIPLDIDFGDDASDIITSDWSTHMVRGTWLSKNQSIFHYGLPSPLLECLCKARCPELRTKLKLQGSLENEMEVLNDLLSIFDGMMENLEDVNEDRSSTEWDIKLALNYKDLQRRIVSSCLNSCRAGLKTVELALYECMEEDTRG
ncbi:[Fructose-bisphosphate aldolase]-lysine N-methyltransferase, chloroplastic, partial [Cucurbita argyrosperma subsp. sororia]